MLGDTHMPRGGRGLPEGCLRLLRESSLILHTGDLTSREFLTELKGLGPVAVVRGNMDKPPLRSELPERLEVEAEGIRLGLVHDGGSRAGRKDRLRTWFPDCDVVAYGHSHLPEVRRFDETWILNPGSPTERRRAPEKTMIVLRAGVPSLVFFGA
ncbi:MAG TPA: metallophosphoesterase family protein [Gaiellaceae bacterium]|nr:metallophosphoesterase family protein [Gaiellaceae bacterium]